MDMAVDLGKKKGHTKRTCTHKKSDDAACAEIAAAEAAKNKAKNPETNVVASEQEPPPSEIDITQPDYSQPLIREEEAATNDPALMTRPDKLPLRRRDAQPQHHPHMDPMQGASAGTTKRLSEIIRTMPTPGFIPLRKK
ncbi:hypothetical protein PIB30_064462 [Stylosanthes scabra]|uniref:Uncharacterized protein n=1 Tax=Stylosanthes scabra TaxID=79078 RepID=A0ABU6VP49_9FABA|nr:hypothetical protein [Stylosanthes scabra]